MANPTRRDFLKTSTVVAAGTALASSLLPSNLYAAGDDEIKVGLIGCGGRGTGAIDNVLMSAPNVRIVALADAFQDRADDCAKRIDGFTQKKEVKDLGNKVDVKGRVFVGLKAYEDLLRTDCNYVILATPPGFRPVHLAAAVAAGKNIFTEKPVAVDGTGCRVMYEAAEAAKQKNLKVAAGTQRRHQAGYIETIKRIQGGEIGDVVALRAYWVNGGPIWHRGDHGDTDLERQIRNWYHYVWLSGDHICEQHVHNLDVCNWIIGSHPVKCWGQGSRQQLGDKSGEIWDNFDVEFEYANGVHMFSYCGQIKRDWSSVSEGVHGTKGTANPAGTIQPKGGQMWRYREKAVDPYVQEHMDLMNAILGDKELNEGKQVTDSTLTAIMGREASYSGAGVNWEDVLNCKFTYGPEMLYQNCAKMEYGAFRTLQPPMPSMHNILKDPPMLPLAKV